jgi:uncharacterized membrane protein
MKLSSQKDLLLIIIISMAVLTISWLRLPKGDILTFIQYIVILLVPGYALITAIWPTDERMSRTMRAGLGFVMGLFFLLFLPLLLNSLKLGSVSANLTNILLIIAILLSLVAMARRKEPSEDGIPKDGAQLTLEESIQRAAEMRQRNVEEHEDVYEEEKYKYYDEDSDYEKIPDESWEDYDEVPNGLKQDSEDMKEFSESERLKEEKPIQYDRIREKGYLEEEPPEEKSKGVPLRLTEPVKTEPLPSDYEAELDKPAWMDYTMEKKPGFRNWDLVMILFLSGISLLFLYFNPLKTTTTSIVFFILLLFILGYAGLTIIFPDKSRASPRNLTISSMIIAVILFILAFLAWNIHLLPALPKYLVKVMFVVSIILVVGAFLRKWLAGQDRAEKVPSDHDEEISPEQDDAFEEKEKEDETWIEPEQIKEPQVIEGVEKTEETPEREPDKSEELTPSEAAKEDTLRKLQTIGTSVKTDKSGIIARGDIKKTPPSFKPRNYYMDIILVAAITILTVAFVLIPPLNKTFVRTIMGILLVLFIPGYSLIAALFPKWGDLEGIERAALSFGLSIAVTPLIGLALNYTPWGIRLDPILISLTIFTLAMCVIAFLRRRKLPEEERFFVPFGQFVKGIKGSFKGESRKERILSIILIISIILAISTTVYIIVKPKQGEKFTEFYILGPNGTASNYPTNLTTGQNGSMIIGVVNHEYATTDYLLVAKVNDTILKNQTLTLTNGQKVEIPYTFTAGSTGQKKLEFLLYKLPDNVTVYRSLHLWVNVR